MLDEQGKDVPRGSGGRLFLSQPWPSMLRTLWGDDERFKKQYWSELPGYLLRGGRRALRQGRLPLGRRADRRRAQRLRPPDRDGRGRERHRIASHPWPRPPSSGRPDDLKGQALVCFVTLKNGVAASTELKEAIRAHVAKEIGSLARPDDVRFAAGLPKTRSGKIMRRILKEIAAGGDVKGDITTLEDFSVVATLQSEE